ncbi:hypothetical protein HMPREF0663_10953 [Hoylesella oralis ATCC 33269]|uniref:Uncharacterized protein n=1 Tax=Hoylesella oralis ATCC 33269 TaxID=873533 RepID=E7RP52_9BACT|nr:hypothetical protein HMPREF0663_10953 [Hoylesella oralis ATCC 33269]
MRLYLSAVRGLSVLFKSVYCRLCYSLWGTAVPLKAVFYS